MKSLDVIREEADAEYWRIVAGCIRERRIKAGMSQKQLASVAGITCAQVQTLERRLLSARSDIFKRCCRALGISMVRLLAEASHYERERLLVRIAGGQSS